jgi:hypothetical protein
MTDCGENQGIIYRRDAESAEKRCAKERLRKKLEKERRNYTKFAFSIDKPLNERRLSACIGG